MRILSLESSTSAAKAMYYDVDTGESCVEGIHYPPDCSRPDGTQDAEGVFQLCAEAARRACTGREVDLLVLVGAWHSVVLCNKDGRPAGPLYSWEATCSRDVCARLRSDAAYAQDYYQRTGCMVNVSYPYFKLLYLQEQGCRLSDYWIMGQGSYNLFRLTGERAVTDCMLSASGIMNIHSRTYDAQLMQALNITEENLCRVVHYDETFRLNAAGAQMLGMKAGTPVIAACSDGGMNQMAVGGYRQGVMSFSVGTSAAIRLSTDKPILPQNPGTWCYLSPVGYMSGAATSGACNCLNWYKNTFLPHLSFKEIEQEYRFDAQTPVFLPFLFGERCPGWGDERMGVFANISPLHTPMSFYQAVCEGILFNIYQCYCRLMQENPVDPRIVLSGGILNSPAWTQMCVDIFNHAMEIPENPQSSLWGGIILGVMLMEGEAAADRLLGSCRMLYPDPERHRVYMKKYEAYLKQYEISAKPAVL